MASKRIALIGASAFLAAALGSDCTTSNGTCPGSHSAAQDTMLLQVGQALAPAKDSSGLEARRALGVTSDCASRLNMKEERNAACLIVQDSKALLVRVPYGSHPGWDFPGGWKHSGEAACQTAEREACEETGYKVRALEQLSWNVFKCEILAEGVCTKPVDEGFLEKQWWSHNDINHLTFRKDTWGDKVGLMKQHLPSVPTPDFVDVCGCKMCENTGFSTSSQKCKWGKGTSPKEACACLQATQQEGDELLDDCGCKACEGEGWSTTVGACAHGSDTDPDEACECRKQTA